MPYMNAVGCGQYMRGKAYRRLDLLADGYNAGKLNDQDVAAARRSGLRRFAIIKLF